MRKADYFAVQRCTDPSALAFEPPVTVEAGSAVEAGERTLGMVLTVNGQKSELVARVIHLNADFSTTTTLLFRKPASLETRDAQHL